MDHCSNSLVQTFQNHKTTQFTLKPVRLFSVFQYHLIYSTSKNPNSLVLMQGKEASLETIQICHHDWAENHDIEAVVISDKPCVTSKLRRHKFSSFELTEVWKAA